jgi:ribonuclease PH
MINIEVADLAGFRLDGRKNDELRNTSIELGVERGASGSCYMKQGMTEVLCIVNGPIEVPTLVTQKRGADRPG